MSAMNYGICESCRKPVPAEHVIRDGKVFLRKDCPECGVTEAMVSSDAATWQHKRDIWHYDPEQFQGCLLNCHTCRRQHTPRMVFLDLTNHCNMNCPICIANVPGMGFDYHPPIQYFEHVLDHLARMAPQPTVHLFGGEPTVREDLFDIIEMAHEKGLRVRIVTNGLRLAEPEFCKRLCDAGVPVLLGFDGRDPEIYNRMRKDPTAYEKKLKALENLRKFSRRKNTIMCCVARKINDRHMRDLVDFCHEGRDYISSLHLIPLTETWPEGTFETDVCTTMEDVEQIIDEAFPEEKVEFVPAGTGHYLERAMTFFGSPRLTFGGVHPNCESATFFLSDGEGYHPIGHYLRKPLDEIAEQVILRANKIEGKLEELDPGRWFQRLRGRLIVVKALGGLVLGGLDFKKLMKGNRFISTLLITGGFLLGKRLKDLLRKYTNMSHTLAMIVLPFEEYHSIDGQRLLNCAAAFAFEDPDTDEVRLIPTCSFLHYKDGIYRKIAEKYRGVKSELPSPTVAD
ncbi:MAG: radical SAM protein [Planctomycetes bacterium]|nr:radical SAM protein [Planctomycetota bacterium]